MHGASLELDQLIERVARGAGDFADDGAVAAGDGVEEHGLADVGAAHDGETEVGLDLGVVGRFRCDVGDAGHEVVDAYVVVGAERDRFAEAELVELQRECLTVGVVGLVHGEGLADCAERVGGVPVGRG